MKQKVFRITIIVLFVVISLLALTYLFAWKSPDYYKVSSPDDVPETFIRFSSYDSISDHERPYIVSREDLLVFGAEHTRDANDAQIMMIHQSWDTFKPTIALVEGRMGFLLPGFMDPVKTLGENGKVKSLAQASGIEVYNWDLSKEQIAERLLTSYNAEQVALAQILNPYFSNLRFGKPSSPENFIAEYIPRAAYVGLDEEIRSVADIDALWNKYFPNAKNWRETSDEYELPGYLGNMMNHVNDLRNIQLIAAIRDLRKKGERIFVVCGSSHAVCIEPAL